MIDDDDIRTLVVRLARPHRSGGDVVERAALMAAGPDGAAIIAWILARGGAPEAQAARSAVGGLHGGREEARRSAPQASRYLLPAGALR